MALHLFRNLHRSRRRASKKWTGNSRPIGPRRRRRKKDRGAASSRSHRGPGFPQRALESPQSISHSGRQTTSAPPEPRVFSRVLREAARAAHGKPRVPRRAHFPIGLFQAKGGLNGEKFTEREIFGCFGLKSSY